MADTAVQPNTTALFLFTVCFFLVSIAKLRQHFQTQIDFTGYFATLQPVVMCTTLTGGCNITQHQSANTQTQEQNL